MPHKQLARSLSDLLRQHSLTLSMSRRLELVAALHGTDWNTLTARPALPRIAPDKAQRFLEERLTACGAPDPERLARDIIQASEQGEHQAQPQATVAAPEEQLPENAVIRQQLGLQIHPQVYLDFAEWTGRDFLGDEDPEEFEDDDDFETELDHLGGLAENLEDWADDLEPRLGGLKAWAEAQEYDVSAEDLGDWIDRHWPGTVLVNAQFLNVGQLGVLGHISLN